MDRGSQESAKEGHLLRPKCREMRLFPEFPLPFTRGRVDSSVICPTQDRRLAVGLRVVITCAA